MISRIVIALISLTSLIGCSSNQDLYIDPQTFPSGPRRNEVLRAIKDWNEWAGTSVLTEGDSSSEWYVLGADTSPWSGFTIRSRSLVRINAKLPDDRVHAAVLHEFGHVLGLRHLCQWDTARGRTASARSCTGQINSTYGVMDPSVATDTFSGWDRQECVKAGVCQP